MKIRNAKIDDLQAITDLILRCSELHILSGFSEEGVQAYLESHSLEKMRERLRDFHYQVMEEAGAIVGIAGVRAPAHLFHLHVAPEFHGRGVGTRLWFAARDEIISRDPHAVITVNASLFAVPFYHRLGFKGSTPQIVSGVEFVPMVYG